MSNLADKLMAQSHAYAIAPAGCGKTQTIAEMIKLNVNGKQLILTHTHAGVQSISKRLKRLKVPAKFYHLDTIASWSLGLVKSYPQTTGFSKSFPDAKEDWANILSAVKQLIQMPFMKGVILASYAGMIVDEYQDCTKSQHEFIIALAGIIPCRLLGDPLQGIFNIGENDKLVDWTQDIQAPFIQINHEYKPHRWTSGNTKLGNWLLDVRKRLEANQNIDLSNAPVNWISSNENQNNRKLHGLIKKSGNTIVIHPENMHAHTCHRIASQMRGRLQSIEEMEAKDLLVWARKIDEARGGKRIALIIDFASRCRTQISTDLKTIKGKFEKSDSPDFGRISKHKEIAEALLAVTSEDLSNLDDAFFKIRDISESYLYRADLWGSMRQAVEFYKTGKYETLYEAAWHARQRQRIIGRTEYNQIISRTLLVKGLEYDHGVLLDAHLFDRKNLYVALTRASKSLTVISDNPILNPKS